MKKIGISYITFNRVGLWQYGFPHLVETLLPYKDEYEIHISISDDGSECYDKLEEIVETYIKPHFKCTLSSGKLSNISRNKNRSLEPLVGVDYLFMFEDDTYPIKNLWLEKYIDILNTEKFGHLMYIPFSVSTKEIHCRTLSECKIAHNSLSSGCMLCLTGEIFEKVGGFYHKFEIYGYEHSDFTQRCNIAQKNQPNLFLTNWTAKKDHWFFCGHDKGTFIPKDIDLEKVDKIYHKVINDRITEEQKQRSISYNGQVFSESINMSNQGQIYREIKY